MLTLLLAALVNGPVTHQAALLIPQAATLNDVRTAGSDYAGNGEDTPPGMVFIPGGEVIVGTDPKEVQRLGQNNQQSMTEIVAETPRHTATVDGFYIDRTEVTNLQWKTYLDATGRKPSDVMVEYSWPGGTYPEGQELYPVSNVSYPEIQEFLTWCGKRLPTELEWIRAARGDDDRAYPWGSKWNSKVTQSGASIPQWPVAVGSHPQGASPYGVLDMGGNVFEWTDSAFRPYEGYKSIDYKFGRKKIPLTPEFDSTKKVAKGGCFVSTREGIRVDGRVPMFPQESDDGLGFRAARSRTPGVDTLAHGYAGLLPARIPSFGKLDTSETEVFSRDVTSYDDSGEIITDFRYVAFAHPGPERGKSLGRLRKEAKDEPVTLGLLVTSEALADPALPPGAYALAWKTRGESKAYKQRKKDEKKAKKNDDDAEAAPAMTTTANGGAAAPWPGIDHIIEDIDFPQDKDVILFYNVNNAVVGWTDAPDVVEEAKTPLESRVTDGGLGFEVEFSLDVTARKVPRFVVPIRLEGAGFDS